MRAYARIRHPWPAFAAAVLAVHPSTANAHEGASATPDLFWTAWNWDAWLLLGVAFAATMYARGVVRLWAQAGPGRGIRRWQVGAAGSGVLALLVSLVSPLDALGHALFSAHMLQHLALIAVAAPLLVLGNPLLAALWALPQTWRHAAASSWTRSKRIPTMWHALARPLPVVALNAAVLWFWHSPPFYQSALADRFVHDLEHVTLFGTALLFWWVVLFGPSGRPAYGIGVFCLFVTSMQSGLLSALITLSPTAWYPVHAAGAHAWGLTAIEDQQLAGLIMWVPAGLAYLFAALVLLALWLEAAGRRVRRTNRHAADPYQRKESLWGC